MRSADAQQQGGDPTDPNFTFTYEAIVREGVVTSLQRTDPCTYTFCSYACGLIQKILACESRPQEGTYVFKIKRDETIHAIFQTPGGDAVPYESIHLWAIARQIKTKDLSKLGKGLQRVQAADVNAACWGLSQMIKWRREHLNGNLNMTSVQCHGLGLIDATGQLPSWRTDIGSTTSFNFGDCVYSMMGDRLYIIYTGIYQTWGNTLAQSMCQRVREQWAHVHAQHGEEPVDRRNSQHWEEEQEHPLNISHLRMAYDRSLRAATQQRPSRGVYPFEVGDTLIEILMGGTLL